MKVLLVDDDALLRDMYATKFTEAGDDVVTAPTTAEALSLLEQGKYDVIVVDMVMPGMGGVEFIKKAKAAEVKGTFIVLSNQSEESDKQAALEVGAVGYIVKAETIPSEVVGQVHDLSS